MKTKQLHCETCKTRGDSLLHFCHQNELENLSENKTCTTYKAGQVIFHEGSMPVGLFCVNSGKIKLHKMGSDGKEQIIRLVKPGDFIGYRALMSSSPFSASATALEEAAICFIPKATFFSILKYNSALSEGLMKLLCANLEESERRLTEMAYKPVRERLAEALIMIKNTYEDKEFAEPEFSFSITREDLAGFVGTAKETVIRLLSDMKKEGLIKADGRKITILEPEKLIHISKMYD
ncbi:MAG: Crp/Fnr family transcriptional regulator [Bacteroidia bacterium]|nr:Crp/Fnr family transcriptional regulator [Bacteroidia bacterium]